MIRISPSGKPKEGQRTHQPRNWLVDSGQAGTSIFCAAEWRCARSGFLHRPTMFTSMRTADPGLVDNCPGEDRRSALGLEGNFREVYA